MPESGDYFRDSFRLHNVHQPNTGTLQQPLQEVYVGPWNDSYVDFTSNQCVDGWHKIHGDELSGSIDCIGRIQNLQEKRSKRSAGHSDRNTLAPELPEESNGLGASVKNVYCRIKYSAE